jgi:hypothetical protein
VEEGKASSFLNDPVGVGSVLDEKLRNEKADLFVLKAVIFFDKSIEHSGQGVVIERVGFVDFGRGHHKKPYNLIVAIHASNNEGSLLVATGLLININILIPQQELDNLFQSYKSIYLIPKCAQ